MKLLQVKLLKQIKSLIVKFDNAELLGSFDDADKYVLEKDYTIVVEKGEPSEDLTDWYTITEYFVSGDSYVIILTPAVIEKYQDLVMQSTIENTPTPNRKDENEDAMIKKYMSMYGIMVGKMMELAAELQNLQFFIKVPKNRYDLKVGDTVKITIKEFDGNDVVMMK